VLSRLLLAAFVLGAAGAGVELLLLAHYEDVWQQIPLAVLAAGLVTFAWQEVRRTPLSLRLFRAAMSLFIAAGLLGVLLHYNSNREFELEMYPSMTGTELLWKTMTGALPALAPGALIHIGLIGFAYAHVRGKRVPRNEQKEAGA
jgi:hypothetical protein